ATRLGFKSGIFTVPYANAAPVFQSTPITTATVGQPYQYQVSATDPNGSPISYVLNSGPIGMSIDAASGLLGWTPTAGSPAQAAVVVQAYNVRGGQTTQQFNITVSGVNLPPVFSTLPSKFQGKGARRSRSQSRPS